MAQRLDRGALLGMTRAESDAERDVASDPDAGLVERAQSGDRQAFDQLVRRYQRPLFHLALRYVKNDADASDVTQRTFVRAYKSLARFRGKSSFRTWVYRIAINQSLNHIRDNKRERASDIADDALTTDAVGTANLVKARRTQRLRDAIEQLPPKQRMVIELRIYDELPFREVAELAGCTENAAKVNFHHAMQRLKAIMGGDPT